MFMLILAFFFFYQRYKYTTYIYIQKFGVTEIF